MRLMIPKMTEDRWVRQNIMQRAQYLRERFGRYIVCPLNPMYTLFEFQEGVKDMHQRGREGILTYNPQTFQYNLHIAITPSHCNESYREIL